ncbi:phospholipid methyltransferase [Paenibacillus mesophilus]|uniref:class I SAM-dependent methyltransferase n=1 Tax=Paenibacillus mesophilus TaxID=2582849 RepID=UPI00110EF5E0|nr:phospholipid methyltransferase [Paenibacillus mesophilus]TMV45244.1 phospholipid methyltransferase [Paenibacillus mesophilus]
MMKVSFLGEFLSNAAQVGSVVPSSRFLTRKMFPPTIPWHKLERIAELGPGTGVFTRYLQTRRSGSSELVLFEQNETFRTELMRQYPMIPILDDALRLGEAVEESGRPFDLIVSGLPFANFPDQLQERLFRTIHDALSNNGTFIAFQYTLLLRKSFQAHFPSMETGYTWMNVPPAWVFKCKKRLS